jgi:hypothetical protein
LSLDLPRGSGQGSADGGARAVLGVQRGDLDSGALRTVHAAGWTALSHQRLRGAAARTSAPVPEPKLGCTCGIGRATWHSPRARAAPDACSGRAPAAARRSPDNAEGAARSCRAACTDRDRDAAIIQQQSARANAAAPDSNGGETSTGNASAERRVGGSAARAVRTVRNSCAHTLCTTTASARRASDRAADQ